MKTVTLVAAGVLAWLAVWPAAADEPRGRHFIAFTNFTAFARTPGASPGETVLTSPEIPARLAWNELIASWNFAGGAAAYLRVEARGLYADHATKYYTMGLYAGDPAVHPRESVAGQKDADGEVSTDTLSVRAPCPRAQVRLTLGAVDAHQPGLKFLSLCLADTQAAPLPLAANPLAWGKSVAVPERSQMAYPNGHVLCSPTTVSMLMSYWATTLSRPDLEHDVPFLVKEIYDPVWKGTGNWALNMAYAGAYPGMRACISRFTDVAEIEDWIAAGLPLGLSVCFDRLAGKEGGPPNGHLVVCLGFTKDGDPVLNDPARLHHVHRVVPRKNLISAWSTSRNTVYLIYPESAKLPRDRFGHW